MLAMRASPLKLEATSHKQQATSGKLLTKQDSGIIKDVERNKKYAIL